MKPRLVFSLVLFLSAYAPLSLLFAVRDIDTTGSFPWLKHPTFVLIYIALAALSLALLAVVITRAQGQFIITMEKAKYYSKDFMEYSIPYIISFFSVDFGKWQDVVALAIFMGLLFLLAVKTQSQFLNPMLALWNYQLYEVEFEEGGNPKTGIFLSKIDLKRDERYKVTKLNRFLFLATEHIGGNTA